MHIDHKGESFNGNLFALTRINLGSDQILCGLQLVLHANAEKVLFHTQHAALFGTYRKRPESTPANVAVHHLYLNLQ